MTYSKYDPAAQNRVPWNFGAKIGPKRPFTQRKTGWSGQFEIARDAREGLFAWLELPGAMSRTLSFRAVPAMHTISALTRMLD